jgi:hypothetical protein
MKTILNWKKGMFSSNYEIYSHGKFIGSLREHTWNQSGDGQLNWKGYHFKTTGFLQQVTQILGSDNFTPIGKITYNSWKTKATITYSDQPFYWKYNNAWNTKWSLYNYTEGIKVKYQGTSSKGTIETDEENELLVLTGLYITNYYWQTSVAVLVACFIPIFVAVLN